MFSIFLSKFVQDVTSLITIEITVVYVSIQVVVVVDAKMVWGKWHKAENLKPVNFEIKICNSLTIVPMLTMDNKKTTMFTMDDKKTILKVNNIKKNL